MLSSDDLRFFVAIAASGSLAGAARYLDVTPPAVSQRLRLLEERLGVRLIERAGRQTTLTEEGGHLAAHGRRILSEMGDLTDALAAHRGVISGNLRVVAPFGFGRRYVAPMAARFWLVHPEITLSLVLSERPARIVEDMWDLMIHVGQLRDSSLVAQRLAPNERFLCASPEYLARHGTPQSPADLRKHDCIALRENDEDVTMWHFASSGRSEVSRVRIEPRLASNDGEVVRSWALAGMGLMIRSEWDVADDLRDGRLVRLLGRWRLPAADVVALLDERHGRAARTAQFLEHLRAELVPAPWRQTKAELGQKKQK